MSNEYILSAEALVYVQGSSKGTQPKYFDNGYWYKVNQLGYEGYAEYLVSKVLECSNVDDFVEYEECKINGRAGCRSKSFLQKNENFISFQRFYEIYTGGNLTDHIRRFSGVSDRIDFVVEFIKKYTELDCRDYLSKILTLDMLILNTDRHFNNLGMIVNSVENTYRAAPIFDNGNALLSDWERFDKETLEGNIEKVIGQPFASNLEYQAYAVGIGLQLDYVKLEKELDHLAEWSKVRGLSALRYQINRYKNIIPDFIHS